MNRNHTSKGFIKYIIIIGAVILVLSYFGFNLRSIVESDTSKGNFSYVWNGVVQIWNTYLAQPAHWLWKEIIVDIIWELIFKPSLEVLRSMSR